MLQAQGHSSIQRACAADAHGEFDAKLCNADFDLSGLAKGLALSSTGRLCLYGPPGTGKTAFGHWLSEEVDTPLILTQIGRASCRERVCHYVRTTVVAGTLKKK